MKTWIVFLTLSAISIGCSSAPPVKSQAYAKLPDSKTFESDFPVVWKAIEAVFRNHKVTDRDPSEVTELEMRKLTRRSLETDWVYSQSRDKYEEYEINGTPRKVYLQTRVKYRAEAKSILGGTEVRVSTEEEVERLKKDGSSGGYESVSEKDSSRANETRSSKRSGRQFSLPRPNA
jgi:hypothetical protein